MRWEEGCDDNNTNNFDGCSSSCMAEANYECNTEGLFSVCYLLNMSIDLVSIIKDLNKNSIRMSFQMSPPNNPSYFN